MTVASLLTKDNISLGDSVIYIKNIKKKLSNNKKLENIATLRYATGLTRGKINEKSKNLKHPYNTFYKPGLPPGPICTPDFKYMKLILQNW